LGFFCRDFCQKGSDKEGKDILEKNGDQNQKKHIVQGAPEGKIFGKTDIIINPRKFHRSETGPPDKAQDKTYHQGYGYGEEHDDKSGQDQYGYGFFIAE
jgi:hypothetical protein